MLCGCIGSIPFLPLQQQQQQMWQPDEERPQWGWNWLERWMATQQWQSRHLASSLQESSCGLNNEDLSEKTVEMDPGRSPVDATHYPGRTQREAERVRAAAFPSYMAATQSAKAKFRAHTEAANKQQQRCPPAIHASQWNP